MVGNQTICAAMEDNILHKWAIDSLQKRSCGSNEFALARVPQPEVVTLRVISVWLELAVIYGAFHLPSKGVGTAVIHEERNGPFFRFQSRH